jgi:hypothetical protein
VQTPEPDRATMVIYVVGALVLLMSVGYILLKTGGLL